MILRVFLLAFSLILAWEAGGQTPSPPEPSEQEDPLVLELRTSGYYELVARARTLGLAETGGVPDLQNRIAQSLGITLPPTATASGRSLSIDSAQQAGVFQVESADGGRLLHLAGDLQVTLVDHDKKVTHVIEAGELWYDQESGEMTARGSVVYTMVRENSREVFRGDSLTFRLEDSEGVFFGGGSDRSRNIASKDVVFRYQGDAIRRGAVDVVTLDSGSITSSLGEDPYYQLKARKIWVLRPGEWGLQNAVLYLGRVPVLWFPFYFQPGDDMFFNPVISFSDANTRRGTSLQTTTYVWGQKTRETSPLSFLQVDDSSSKDTNKVIRGLYLTRGKREPSSVPSAWTFKILADFYSHLGFLSGLEVSLPDWGPFKTFKATGGIGLTRNVAADGRTWSANPFNALLSPAEQSTWNGSWAGTVRLPFRWGGTFEAAGSAWSLSLEYFTDPLLWGDLTAGRSENFSLFSLIGLEPAKKTTSGGTKSSLQWKASTTLPSGGGFSGNLTGNLLWEAKKAVPALAAEDPESSFFLPSQLILPTVTAQWSGDFLKARQPDSPARGAVSALPALLPPDAAAEPELPPNPSETPLSGEEDLPLLLEPSLLPPLANPAAAASFSDSLTWNFSPSFRTDTRFDTGAIASPRDGWATPLSARWIGSWDGRLGYTGAWSDASLSVNEALSLHQQKQDTWYLAPEQSESVRLTYETQDKQQTSSLLMQSLSGTWKPLTLFRPLRESSVGYTLSAKLWEQKDAQNLVFDGTAAMIPSHQVTASAQWQWWEPSPSVRFGATWQSSLPPLATSYSVTPTVEIKAESWKLTTRGVWKNSGEQWKPDPLESQFTLTPQPGISVQQSFLYDLQKFEPSSATTVFNWAGLSLQYRHQQTTRYVFEQLTRRWKNTGEQGFFPQEASLAYKLSVPLLTSWKNRQNVSGNLSLTWPVNLQQYSQMPLTITYGLTYKLHRFLDLQISEGIINRTAFRYFPWLVNSLGTSSVTSVNPLVDLADSLAFWDDAARRRGGFKMTTLTVGLVHYLEDWQIKLDYSGSPQLSTTTRPQFQWTSTFSLFFQWNPVPELKTNVLWDKTGKLSFKTD